MEITGKINSGGTISSIDNEYKGKLREIKKFLQKRGFLGEKLLPLVPPKK